MCQCQCHQWGCILELDRERFRRWVSEVRQVAEEENASPELVAAFLVGLVPEENRMLLNGLNERLDDLDKAVAFVTKLNEIEAEASMQRASAVKTMRAQQGGRGS